MIQGLEVKSDSLSLVELVCDLLLEEGDGDGEVFGVCPVAELVVNNDSETFLDSGQ